MNPLDTYNVGMARHADLLAEAERARLVRAARSNYTGPSLGARIGALGRRLAHPAAPAACPQPEGIRK